MDEFVFYCDLVVGPVLCCVIIFIHLFIDWNIFRKNTAQFYVCSKKLLRLINIISITNLLGAILYLIVIAIKIPNNDSYQKYIPACFYLVMSLILIISRNSISVTVNFSPLHILITLLVFVNYIFCVFLVPIFWFSGERLILAVAGFPFCIIHFVNILRFFNYSFSKQSTLIPTDRKNKSANIFYLFCKILFLWDIKIFFRKFICLSGEYLTPLPKTLRKENSAHVHDFAKSNKSIWRFIFCFVGKRFLLLGLLLGLSTLLTYGQPVALEHILSYLSDKSQIKWCILWMIVLVLSNLLSSLTRAQFDYQIAILGLLVKSLLMSNLITSIIRVPAYLRPNVNTGLICNLASVDLDKINDMAISVHTLWCIVLEMSIALYLLYRQIRIYFLFGVAFCIILVPINFWLGKKIDKYSMNILSFSDQRIKTLKEALMGITVVKLNGWVTPVLNLLYSIRNKEFANLSKEKYLDAFCVFFWVASPSIVAAMSLGIYEYFNNDLTSVKILTSLSIFYLINTPINSFSCAFLGVVQAKISGKRWEDFLNAENASTQEFPPSQQKFPGTSGMIEVIDSTFCYDAKSCSGLNHNVALTNINIKIDKNTLVRVAGGVGSGKSGLLKSIIGELHHCKGTIKIGENVTICYISQNPWLFKGSVRDNILRGSEYSKKKYNEVIDVCCLRPDIESFDEKDKKDVGLRGCKVSGGQRTRICLAAAIYSNADLYLFDDVLSAIDQKVSDEIFQKCIKTFLCNKSIVICTNSSRYANLFKENYVIEDKTLKHPNRMDDNDAVITESIIHEDARKSVIAIEEEESILSMCSRTSSLEYKMSNYIPISVYIRLLKNGPMIVVFVFMLSIFILTVSKCLSEYWLLYQFGGKDDSIRSLIIISEKLSKNLNSLIVYGISIAVISVLAMVRAFSFAYVFLEICRRINNTMGRLLLSSNFSYFENLKIGSVINKFLTDTYAVDETIPFMANIVFSSVFNLLGTIAIICISSPIFLIILPITAPFLVYIIHFYRGTTSVVKRMTSEYLNPIYDSLSEIAENSSLIRISKISNWIKSRFTKRYTDFLRSSHAMAYISASLTTILCIFSWLLQILIMICSVISFYYFDFNSKIIGLAITHSLTLNGSLLDILNSFIEMDKSMVHAENIFRYTDELKRYSSHLPSSTMVVPLVKGDISFTNVKLSYCNKQQVYPNGLTFKIPHGTKVGICGRTGSGKSTIMKLLFRINQPDSGSIRIDDEPLESFDENFLSSLMLLVTQEPVIFSAPIRFNIDLSGNFSDAQLNEALQKINFCDLFPGMTLDTVLDDHLSLSAGQKQLIIIARAILRSPKIICLDEATSNLDSESENQILNLLFEEFKSSTIINISHRLNCLTRFDVVMMLKDGVIVENDNVSTLMAEKSIFSELLNT